MTVHLALDATQLTLEGCLDLLQSLDLVISVVDQLLEQGDFLKLSLALLLVSL